MLVQGKVLIGFILGVLLGSVFPAQSAKLSIVIDDFGYRPHNEQQILNMPVAISIAILPDAPYHRRMAEQAYQQGREILIHLPMAPLSKQPLERDTLQPTMSEAEIQRIIQQAIENVPYASGLNNHMGSAMTSSLLGMQKVMRILAGHHMYFLDSMTTAHSKAIQAAAGTGVQVIQRHIFLDDTQNTVDIRRQFNRAIQLARKQGFAIAIGHPHPQTIQVLQQMLPQLPADIVLVKPSALLRVVPQSGSGHPPATPLQQPVFKGIGICQITLPTNTPESGDALNVILHSLERQPIIRFLRHYWAHWSS